MPIAALIKIGMRWLVHLGPAGLIGVGIVDESIIPLPGSIDIVLILLVASRRNPLWLCWLAAMVGAVFGGWLTYRIAKKGGKEALEKRVPRRVIQRVERAFDKGGWIALAIAGLAPPPFPITPVLIGAGALQYPTRKFLTALSTARAIRYTIVVYLAHHYGRGIMRTFNAHKLAISLGFLAFSLGAGIIGALYTRYELRKQDSGNESEERAA